jgi:hypothetical protein
MRWPARPGVRQEALLDQDVDARRRRVCELALEQADGAGILVPAENKLFFLVAGHHVRPHRQDGAHQHRHHAHTDEQGRHGIARRRALTG